jgi:exosortase/archaeosortase family protein
MTEVALRPGRASVDWRAGLRRLGRAAASPDGLLLRRTALAVGLIVVAFHYTLQTVARTLSTETPLAYLGLVPVIAILLAAAMVRPQEGEPAIHDRQLDYIVGVPLLIAALSFDVVMPVRLSTLFWLDRLDLVSLPVFVAGTVCLLFGVRTLWRLRVPVLFLTLAWPLPYSTLLVNWLTAFTSSTLGGLNLLLRLVHVATAEPAQGLGTYFVHQGHTGFQVSVASACSGVNGIVGYVLVVAAFLTVVVGTWRAKIVWFGLGLVAVWTSNVLRIFMILVVGAHWGETLAIDVLHPIAGLVLFNAVILGMVLVMGRFGLEMSFAGSRSRADLTSHLRQAVPTIRAAAAVLVAAALLGYLANSSLRSFDLVETSLGAPRLTSFSDSPTSPTGWSVAKVADYTWAKPFFGQDSTWYRFEFAWGGDKTADLRSNQLIISDVINTSDLSSLSTYGIEACYRFHGYKLHSVHTVELGAGVAGNVLAYYNTSTRSDWTTLYFHWPVKAANGKTRYERVTLMLVNTQDATFTGSGQSSSFVRNLGLGVQNAIIGEKSPLDAHFARTENFLAAFAHELIAKQVTAPPASLATTTS